MAQQEGGWLKIGHIKTETMEFYSELSQSYQIIRWFGNF